MGFIFPSVNEMLAQGDKVKRLSSHRQHLTPSSPVGADLLVEFFPLGLAGFWFWFISLLYLFDPLLLLLNLAGLKCC